MTGEEIEKIGNIIANGIKSVDDKLQKVLDLHEPKMDESPIERVKKEKKQDKPNIFAMDASLNNKLGALMEHVALQAGHLNNLERAMAKIDEDYAPFDDKHDHLSEPMTTVESALEQIRLQASQNGDVMYRILEFLDETIGLDK